jgi:hypothetical protein
VEPVRRLFLWWVFACMVLSARADVAVLTQHNDLARTGANLNETLLNTGNVNSKQFGLLYTRPVDDDIFAQPLIMTNVNLGAQGTHNIVIVATANNTVYAFDADDPSVTIPYWTDTFTNPPTVVSPTSSDFESCAFFPSHIGIIGTPVIDPCTGTLYFVTTTQETTSTGFSIVQRLHALDAATGIERSNSPVVIAATCTGTNSFDSSTNGVIVFNAAYQLQRSGLTLVNGTLYIAWASYCDFFFYHGWLMAYDAATLQQLAVYNDTPDGLDGGIWMGGEAPAADTNGNIYVSTGNGTVGDPTNAADTIDRGESFLKFTLSGTNFVLDSFFTPYNWSSLNSIDADLGSAGMVLIPGTALAFSGGKGGTLYLVNKDNMGGVNNTTDNVVQSFSAGMLFGGPVWWDGPNASWAYFVGTSNANGGISTLHQYEFNESAGMFSLTNVINKAANYFGILAISSNGTNNGTGIIWQSGQQRSGAGNQPGILTAYDARNVGTELYSSQTNRVRDSVGNYATFSSPTVANGKVYLATFSTRLDVYGLLPPSLSASLAGGNVVLSWPTNNYPNYVLQTSPDLLSGDWSIVTNGVAVTNGVYQVSVPASEGASFFRLEM